MDIGLIRQRLGSAPSTIAGLTCYTFTPDSVTPPCFYPSEVDLTYAGDPRLTFGGEPVVEVVCTVLTSSADDQRGQELLDSYLATTGTTSIKAALETDKTLSGACKTLHVHHIDGYRLYTVGAYVYYGARFRVLVLGG